MIRSLCALDYTRPYFRKQKLKGRRRKKRLVLVDNSRIYTDCGELGSLNGTKLELIFICLVISC